MRAAFWICHERAETYFRLRRRPNLCSMSIHHGHDFEPSSTRILSEKFNQLKIDETPGSETVTATPGQSANSRARQEHNVTHGQSGTAPDRHRGRMQDSQESRLPTSRSSTLLHNTEHEIKLGNPADDKQVRVRGKDDSRPTTTAPSFSTIRGFACPYLKYNPAVYAGTLQCNHYYPDTHRMK